MKIGFLIITYGNQFINKCVSSIQNFHENVPIFIVDNMINRSEPFDNYDLSLNISYSKNINNNFELGSIWFATKKWNDIDKFIILHNSMILLQKLPDFVFVNDFVPFWQADAMDYSPEVPCVEKWLKDKNITLEKNVSWKSICGCCCSINTSILKHLIDFGWDTICAKNKNQAVACEILFGYLIHYFAKIMDYRVLNEFPIYTYYHNKEKSVFIKKIGSGQGLSNKINNYYKIKDKYDEIFNIFKTNFSQTDNYINLLEYAYNNNEFGNYLIQCYPGRVHTGNEVLDLLLCSITHRMFSKKYFPDSFLIEYENIIQRKKIIF